MAINLIFIDFIVPVSKIRALYPGGWARCLYDHRRALGRSVYFDQNLFHTGAMSGERIDTLVAHWSNLGFQATERVDGKELWRDFCAVSSALGSSRYLCQWLGVDYGERCAFLIGTDPGPVAGRRFFHERRKSPVSRIKFKLACRLMGLTAVLIYRLRMFRSLSASLSQWLTLQQVWERGQGT